MTGTGRRYERPGPVRTDSAGADDPRDLGDRGASLADLLQTVVAQPAHPLADGQIADLLGGAAFERERVDLGETSITSYSPTRPR